MTISDDLVKAQITGIHKKFKMLHIDVSPRTPADVAGSMES